MKRASFSALGLGAVALTAIMPAAMGAPRDRAVSPPSSASAGALAGGLALTSASIDLPDDEALYPDGPHADVVNANCIACHSASMALLQPKLTPEQWAATIEKMRTVFHAPIAQSDVPAILAYLTAMPGQGAPAPTQPPGGTR